MTAKKRTTWEVLSVLDVSKHVEEKGNLSYLSWAWAWGTLMNIYPESTYTFDDPVFYDNGSCEVWVTVTIENTNRRMWLPVMDFRNNSVPNPSSRQISDTRMRCLVKCLAMFGLGFSLYAGEDLPDPKKDAEVLPEVMESTHRFEKGEADEITAQALACLEMGDSMGLDQVLDPYRSDPDVAAKVWALFNASQRSTMKTLLAENRNGS